MSLKDNVKYGFYTSQNHDRVYENTDFSRVFSAVINDGIFANIGEKFAVTPSSGMTVRIGSGRAWFNDTWTSMDSAGFLTFNSAASNYSRIDAVVLIVDKANRENVIDIIQGIPSVNPVKPSMESGSEDIFYHPLAYVTIPAQATAVTAADIEIAVPKTTPYVTGPMQVADMSYLFSQWESQFTNWFVNLQDELDSNQAANLQNQINKLSSHYAICETAASDSTKTATLNNFELTSGAWAFVNFKYTNSADLAGLKLNINNTGAKDLKFRNEILTDQIVAGLYLVVYDGTVYQLVGGGIGAKKEEEPVYTASRIMVTGSDGKLTASNTSSAYLSTLRDITPDTIRKVYISTSAPSGNAPDGSIWIKYKA